MAKAPPNTLFIKSSTNWSGKGRNPAAPNWRRWDFSIEEVKAFIGQAKPTAELRQILENLEARGMREFTPRWTTGSSAVWPIIRESSLRHSTFSGEFRAIAGGGRYDNLVKLISNGKVNLPALGFGMGDVVLLELLKARGRLPKFDVSLDAFCLIEDPALRGASLKVIQELRSAGLAVDYSLTPAKSDKQFKRAQEFNAVCVAEGLDRSPPANCSPGSRTSRPVEEKSVSPMAPGCGPGARLCRWLRQWK